MKKALFLLTIIALFSCTKENQNSINGRWKIVETHNDVPPYVTSLDNTGGYIEFKANGEFGMDNSTTYANYKALKEFSRYSIVSNEKIELYSSTRTDTVVISYYFDKGLILSLGYVYDRFTR
jgi:predicted porin